MILKTGMKTETFTFPKRGEVYLVSFDPTIGAEIKKTRPAVILQNDIGNQYSSTAIVAAITGDSNKKSAPVSVPVMKSAGGLAKDSLILLNQLRTIDKRRLGKRLGAVSTKTMQAVDRQLKVSLGLSA